MIALIVFLGFTVIGMAEEPAQKLPPVRYDLWHVEEGYRLGFISNFGQQGVNELWNYEGQLNLGTSTAEGPIYDRPCMEEHAKSLSIFDRSKTAPRVRR